LYFVIVFQIKFFLPGAMDVSLSFVAGLSVEVVVVVAGLGLFVSVAAASKTQF